MVMVQTTITGSVARIALDRPPLNVLDIGMARELAAAATALSAMHDLHAIVLVANGSAFSAGVDVRDHLPDRGAEMLREFHQACLALWNLDTPTVARVHGAALGGGVELTLMCDMVVAGHGATFAFPEIRLGVFPPIAAVLLSRMIPAHVAADLILTGRELSAIEAERAGLVNRAVEDDALDDAVDELLGRLCALSASSLRVTKQAMRLAKIRAVPDAVGAAESHYLRRLLDDRDAIEGLSAFLEKRPAKWRS